MGGGGGGGSYCCKALHAPHVVGPMWLIKKSWELSTMMFVCLIPDFAAIFYLGLNLLW